MGKRGTDSEIQKWFEMKLELEVFYCKNIDEKVTTLPDANNPNMIY